jgi:hypothetical protein
MMLLKISIRYYGSIGRRQREVNNAMRDALRDDVAAWWAGRRALRHFQPGAEQAYLYAPRGIQYRRRKQREAQKRGERSRPLVFRGALEAEIKAGGVNGWNKRAWATSAKTRLRISRKLPHHMFRVHAMEVTALNRPDFRHMCGLLNDGFCRRLDAVRAPEFRRIT